MHKKDLLDSVWVKIRMGKQITDVDTGCKIAVSKQQVGTLVDAVIESIVQGLECGDTVAIPGLGIFTTKQYPEGSLVRDVRTGEMRPRRADRMRAIRFKPSSTLKERVNVKEGKAASA